MRLLTLTLNSLIVILFVVGCAQPTRNAETSQPANIASPTKAMTDTPKPTLTAEVIPTNDTTDIQILPEEEARAQLLDLLANNGNCRLPCLWGITPGKSTSIEAQEILTALNSISISINFGSNGGSIAPWYTENELILSTTLGFNSENGIVNYLTFKAGEYKETASDRSLVFNSKIFGERLRPYMLSGILSEFGKPALVVIHTSGKQITGSGGFEVLLFYPNQGIFVHYTTQMESEGDIVHGCLANAHVELRLYPSGDANAFTKALSQTEWAFAWPELADNPSWKPIDKATSMSLEQFYETFRQPTDKCIETPLKEWYVPG